MRKCFNCNSTQHLAGSGDGRVTFGDGNVKLKNIMHVPGLAVNLSVSQIAQNGNTVMFNKEGCSIFNNEKQRVMFCKSTSGVYRVIADDEKCLLARSVLSALEWHRRLGHASYPAMKKMRAGAVDGVNFADCEEEILNCETCSKGKQSKKLFRVSETDLMGPQNTKSLGQALYLLTFIDFFFEEKIGDIRKIHPFQKIR